MRDEQTQQYRRIMFALALALIVSRVLAAYVLPIYDDAFITMRYARNLAAGMGFTYQSGERVLGATCPLFGVVQTAFYALHLPMPFTLIAFNIALEAATFVMGARLLQRIGNASALFVFALFVIINPIMARICVGGMEMNLHLLLTLSAITLFHAQRSYLAVAVATVAYFVRPESALLVAVLCAEEWFTRAGLRRALAMGLLSLAIVAVPSAAIWSYYGTVVPQSVIAKATLAPQPIVTLLRELLFNDPLQLVLVPLAFVGAYLLRHKPGAIRTLTWLSAALALAYIARRAVVFSWYGELIHYTAALLAAVAVVEGIARYVPRLSSLTERPLGGYLLGSVGLAVWAATAVFAGQSRVQKQVYAPMEQWFQQHASPERTIMAADIGVVGYYSDNYIYDTAGLVWPEAMRYKSQVELLQTKRPDLVLLNACDDYPEVVRAATEHGDYAMVATFAKDPIDYDNIPNYWVQRYVLLERQHGR